MSEPMGSQSHREYKTKTRKLRFQDQWVTKTIENTNKNKHTKILEPMIVNQNHWSWNRVLFVLFLYALWFSLPIGTEILVVLFVFVFSMVFVTHWFWNLGFLVCVCILDGFGYPLILESWLSWFYPWFVVTHWSFLVNMCMLKVLFRHSETTHKLENMYMA